MEETGIKTINITIDTHTLYQKDIQRIINKVTSLNSIGKVHSSGKALIISFDARVTSTEVILDAIKEFHYKIIDSN